MNLLLAAISGWGKSHHTQAILEESLKGGEYDHAAILDFCDEYRGLVKAGFAKHLIVGPREAEWSPATWREVFQQEPYLVLARLDELAVETWRETCARIIQGVRRLDSPLVAIDEAHFVAPQRAKLLDPIKELATTGRGAGASALWISQRLSELDETPIAQCQSRMLGAFRSDSDLNKLKGSLEYPVDAHKPGGVPVTGNFPDQLLTNEGQISVRKWEDPPGSEWFYSTDSGKLERVSTRGLEMDSTHYGQAGNDLELPEYG